MNDLRCVVAALTPEFDVVETSKTQKQRPRRPSATPAHNQQHINNISPTTDRRRSSVISFQKAEAPKHQKPQPPYPFRCVSHHPILYRHWPDEHNQPGQWVSNREPNRTDQHLQHDHYVCLLAKI